MMKFHLGEFDWTALGVVIQVLAFVGLAISILSNAQAIRLSAQVANAAAATEVSERLAEAGRRFEEARKNNNEQKMKYELSYMGAIIETYLVTTDPIRKHVDSDPAHVVKGATCILASALPSNNNQTTVAKKFEDKGFSRIAKLAEEMKLQTGRPCP